MTSVTIGNNKSFSKPAASHSGIYGGVLLGLIVSIYLFLLPQAFSSLPAQQQTQTLTQLLVILISIMLGKELLHLSSSQENTLFGSPIHKIYQSDMGILRSALFRYLALLAPWGILTLLILNHYYFQQSSFRLTREIFEKFFVFIAILGLPYIWMTLRFRGQRKYEFGDYAILWIALYRRIWFRLLRKTKHPKKLPKRIRKLLLGWLVTAFFFPLMLSFFDQEFLAAAQAVQSLKTLPEDARWFSIWREIYLFLYHLIFVIDTGIASAAYAMGSRWLNNRIQSVDTSLYGWLVCLICYPPFSYGFISQWIDYSRFSTSPIITSEIGQSLIMLAVLLLFTIYVWATMSLGFRFSNLCHRGIVDSGPYKWFRHPAYTCKNIAWWLDNTYILTNIGATLAMAIGNAIYWQRGITEEHHLRRYPDYRDYCKRVPCRFLPRLRGLQRSQGNL